GTKKLSKGEQKMRWCPQIGAGTKKLSRGGQKMRWCPQIGAGTKKLSRGGQKLRWCPQIGAGTKKLTTPLPPTGGAAPPLFLFYSFNAAANELIRIGCAGDTCWGCSKRT
ncbi:MAG: hypothetical protein QM296_08335, partial [Bacillota bacterium]|nr:hypothetical protein [Bacillota bacterium]